jgi:putative membrane protein
MFKSLIFGFILSATLVFSSAAQSSNSSHGNAMASGSAAKSSLSPADKRFVDKAAEGGMAEVELGQLATQKAASEDVKKFGQRMVDDHSKANDQLKELASSKGVNLPSGLDAKDQATKERLSKLSGEQFDHAYMQDMVKDHTKDVAEFRHESTMAKDPDVKNFASQTLPTLQEHLSLAKSIAPQQASQAKK